MATILHIQASPLKEHSFSHRVAKAFLESYLAAHPNDTVTPVDVFDGTMTEFGASEVSAKYKIMHSQPYTPTDAFVWKNVEAAIAAFKSADKYVISSAMWNFSIPYMLKKYVDIIVQPGYTVAYSPEKGYEGLVTGKPVLLILARSGAYGKGSGMEAYDFQQPYLEAILKFIGFTDIQSIVIEPTLAEGTAQAAKVLAKASDLARKMAKKF